MRTSQGQGQEADARRGAADRARRKLGVLIAVLCAALAVAGASASSALAEGPTVKVQFTCTSVSFTFSNFPNAENNTVQEIIYVDGQEFKRFKFHFNGPTGSNTVTVHVPPGHHGYDARAAWRTNGVRGQKDTVKFGGITCEPDPAFTVEKDQRIAGSKEFTTQPIPSAHVGQTLEYAIEVTNTGNVPLKLSSVSDPNCEAITGGPEEIAPEAEAIFKCHHKLNKADGEAGEYCNTAQVTGEPPGGGTPVTEESNTVCAELPEHPKFNQEFSCKQITFFFFGFPKTNGNTVIENVYVDGKNVFHGTFTFNGSSGSNTVTLNLPPGKHKSADARARWNTNGVKGEEDHPIKGGFFFECPAEPAFTIVDKQKIAGSSAKFTENEVEGKVGDIDDYDVTIKNTGNVPFKITSFFDVFAEITTGPVSCPVAPKEELKPGESTDALCEKQLTEPGEGKDHATAEVKPSEGPSFSHESNTDIVKVSP